MQHRLTGGHTRILDFGFFVLCTIIIVSITYRRGVFLLAPPYDVTAYLVLFEKTSKFSRPLSVGLSYVAVIVSTLILHTLIGDNIVSLTLNVLFVAAFISSTKYSHPPALALTIFSYLTKDILGFAVTSLTILIVIFGVHVLATRVMGLKRGKPNSAPRVG
jgi:CBS-domain-containing membrane protein